MLLVVQLLLGLAAYLARLASPNDPQPLNPMISITVAHVACGALVFVTTIVLTLRTYRVLPATGAAIVRRALEEPLRQLAENAGLEGSVVVGEVKSKKAGIGLNVDTGEYVDLVKAGIIDPAMVTRSALQNAASIAKNIITTETLVVNKPEESGGGGMGPNMGGGMPPGMM